MKEIVFVIGNYKNGGVAMHSTNLVNEFAKRGYKCILLATKGIGEDLFVTMHERVRLISLDDFFIENSDNPIVLKDKKDREKKLSYYKKLRYISKGLKKWDKSLEEKIKAIRKNEKLRAYLILNREAVYIPFGVSYFENVFAASDGLEIKIIYAEKNAPQLELPKDKEKQLVILNNMKSISGAVVQTEDEASYYNDYVKDNLAVIHNPVKAGLPEPYKGERQKKVVNFCRISGQKNLPLLIDAFKLLHRDYPEYTLEIYGNTVEENEEKLRDEFVKELKASNRDGYIKILPPSGRIHSLIRDYAMFVSSSDFEGLSNSMVEAMSIGMPCVCTDCLGGGAREMIKDGENGLLVPMKDAEALYKAMKRFIEDKELSIKCAENAAKIREELSVEKIAEKWLEVIEKV